MIEIKDKNGKLCHLIHRFGDFQPGRKDLIDTGEFIQVAALQMEDGKTFKPHKHNWNPVDWGERIPQESWVILSGFINVDYYDPEGEFIIRKTLSPGDCSITLEGGHNYTATCNDCKVYEFKTGPYQGQEHDKTFI